MTDSRNAQFATSITPNGTRVLVFEATPYWAGINPLVTATLDGQGNVTRVTVSYPRDAVGQYLPYGSIYRRWIGPVISPPVPLPG